MADSASGRWLTWVSAGAYYLRQKPSDDIEFWEYIWEDIDEKLANDDVVYFDSKEEAEAAGFIVSG